MWYVFINLEEFNDWHSSVMATLGLPDGVGTEVYSEPLVHPTTGVVLATVDERADMTGFSAIDDSQVFALGFRELPDYTTLEG